MTDRQIWTIKLTHIPTGTSVETNSHLFRTQKEAHEAMIKLLKSKLWYCDKSLFSNKSLMDVDMFDLTVEDAYVCDCEKNYGKDCKHPEKYREGGCN